MGLSTKTAIKNNDPGFGIVAVTPSDTVPIKGDSTPSRGISLAVAGVVSFLMADGTSGDAYLLAGIIHPIRAVRVNATGTDADLDIRAWF